MKNLFGSLHILFLTSLFLILTACSDSYRIGEAPPLHPDAQNVIEMIPGRDIQALIEFTHHESMQVRSLAWRAISKSKMDSLQIQMLLEQSMKSGDWMAWTSLRHQDFSADQLQDIHQYTVDTTNLSAMCDLFFRIGTQETLNILLAEQDLLFEEPACAKAAGGILWRIKVTDSLKKEVIEAAFNTEKLLVRRNLLYGFYRSELNRPEEGSKLHGLLMNGFKELEPTNEIDWVYAVRIGGKEGFQLVMDHFSDDELNKYVQLSNTMVSSISQFSADELRNEWVVRFLQHGEEIVVAGVLQSLKSIKEVDASIVDLVANSLASTTGDPHVMVHSMHLLLENSRDIFRFFTKIERMDREAPYLKHLFLPLFDEIETSRQFSERLRDEIRAGGIRGMHAAGYLARLSDKSEARTLFRFAFEIGDVSVIRGLAGLVGDSEIVRNGDFGMIQRVYDRFAENNEMEKIEELNPVLEQRFPDRFAPVEIEARPYRYPDWQRLTELGSRPLWILDTTEGEIAIELHTEKAPFTVSSIDSLSRAGHYNGTAIHRVVPNFVIQGGDYTRRDGYGSPGYRIPTEPSFDSFERGKVGIASSGQDTEGGQFFIMHQWAPHLDGNYTIFGEVIRGMDVVDRIQVGDRVVGTELVIGSLRI